NIQVAAFAEIIGVDAALIRPDDRLGELLCVSQNELPENLHPLMMKFGFKGCICVHAFDLLQHVEERVASDRTIADRPTFQPLPRSEDEWLDRLMAMTVGEFVRALA